MAREAVNLLQSAQIRRALGVAGLEYVRANHSYAAISQQFQAELLDAVQK